MKCDHVEYAELAAGQRIGRNVQLVAYIHQINVSYNLPTQNLCNIAINFLLFIGFLRSKQN